MLPRLLSLGDGWRRVGDLGLGSRPHRAPLLGVCPWPASTSRGDLSRWDSSVARHESTAQLALRYSAPGGRRERAVALPRRHSHSATPPAHRAILPVGHPVPLGLGLGLGLGIGLGLGLRLGLGFGFGLGLARAEPHPHTARDVIYDLRTLGVEELVHNALVGRLGGQQLAQLDDQQPPRL